MANRQFRERRDRGLIDTSDRGRYMADGNLRERRSEMTDRHLRQGDKGLIDG